ncbi:MAG: dihydroorotate dehydrogenase electron transfer subunit [Muribaculaceae bacterium]
MKKYLIDFRIAKNNRLSDMYSLLELEPIDAPMPEMLPGQFVQIEVKGSKNTYLRRPISINFVDYKHGRLWLLVRKAGEGTASIIDMKEGESLNLILPLGNGFTIYPSEKMLLIGGGVGVAPLLYLGKKAQEAGAEVEFLLGARSKNDLLELEEFKKYGTVHISTEDGSLGEKGFVTQHSVLVNSKAQHISCCGPMPMMKAVAKIAADANIDCEVSLENVMACGLGACLCCVEDTIEGNVCVCKEGPVFNIKRLKW